MHQIVCLSTSNYHPFPTRKQNVMNRLQDAEILYFDPPVTWLAPLKDKQAWARLGMHRKGGEQARDNLTVYALPPVLPFGNKLRWINRWNQRRQARYVRRMMAKHGFEKPLLWCYSPTAADIVAHIPHSALVYDCVDRHSAYTGMIDPAVVDGMEQELASQADQVFCTAQGLYETLVSYNPHTKLIPNGAAYELFAQAATVDTRKKDQPVLGFVGMLQDCIAYDYLLAAARAFPYARIELIGRVMPGVDISELEAQPNIQLVGLLPQTELPGRMKNFHLCLNLFAPGRLSKDVSPLKFYEYLATGKPIVSTTEPLQVQDYQDLIYIAESPEQFVELCAKALAENDSELRQRRMDAGRAASWDNRVRQMEEELSARGLW